MDLTLAFFLGFAGSLHCAGMCGPLVLAVAARSGGAAPVGRVIQATCYNLGRVSMYAALGLFAGALGEGFRLAGFQRALSLALGCGILVWVLLREISAPGSLGLAKRLSGFQPSLGVLSVVKRQLGRLVPSERPMGQLAMGALNGLLPCGLVYTACVGALAASSWLGAVLWMLLFGLGTVPMMLGFAWWGGRLTAGVVVRLRFVVPWCSVALGLLLVVRGVSLGVPSVLSALGVEPSCCPLPK